MEMGRYVLDPKPSLFKAILVFFLARRNDSDESRSTLKKP